jgi:orotate phosphoribosyltransferase
MAMDPFIELLLTSDVVRFGEFKTKSGRLSPYFFNAGNFDSGERLGKVAELYAKRIAERFGTKVDNLFGPAYKGIPLAVMTAFHLSRLLGRDISFTFNRKEVKDHGEGGNLVGRSYKGGEKVVIVEDVITGGTSINESMPLLQKYGVHVLGVVVGIDRQEKGTGDKAASREVLETWGVPVESLTSVTNIVSHLHNREVLGRVWIDDAMRQKIASYQATYGVPS